MQEFGGGDGVFRVGVYGNVDKGGLDGVPEGSAGGIGDLYCGGHRSGAGRCVVGDVVDVGVEQEERLLMWLEEGTAQGSNFGVL